MSEPPLRHLVIVGVCYLDTILSVPYFPAEDSKLRATAIATRRGGNSGNLVEVLAQLLKPEAGVRLHLVAPMPARDSAAAASIMDSFAAGTVDISRCLFRRGYSHAPSCYVIRSEATGSRTIVSGQRLPEMTVDEFRNDVLASLTTEFPPAARHEFWFHFEARIPDTLLQCVHALRSAIPRARVSVEYENPDPPGQEDLVKEADVVFYSRQLAEVFPPFPLFPFLYPSPLLFTSAWPMPAWASTYYARLTPSGTLEKSRNYESAADCLKREVTPKSTMSFCTWGADGATAILGPDQTLHRYPKHGRLPQVLVTDSIGAGDTFIAGILFGVLCHREDWDIGQRLRFAVELATLKVQREGFDRLGSDFSDPNTEHDAVLRSR